MKNMRLSAIGSAFLLACLGISCCCERQEQVHKPGSMTITSTISTLTDSTYPFESSFTAAELCVENVAIEMGTLICTADTGLLNKETSQIRLIGDVVIITADGIKITAEEVVFESHSPVENSNSLAR